MDRKRLAAAAALWLVVSGNGWGSETDNLTYRYVRLEESSPRLNPILNDLLDEVLRKTNEKLAAQGADPRRRSDAEAELTFTRTYTETLFKKFGDRLLPLIGTCIETNDCQGWPKFERIPLEKNESIYGEACYNKIAIAFLAPTFQLCGVRMGTDKLTHLFSHGFFYYNAARAGKARLESEEDALRMGLADERGMMGTHSTSVVSPADAAASAAGFRLAMDYFFGEDPVFSRDSETGLLQRRRDVDVCSYVSPAFDEEINRPTFTAGKKRRERLEAAIAERRADNERAETELTAGDREALKERLVGRALDPGHARLPWSYKIYLVFKYLVSYLTIPKESREPASFLVFPDFKLEHRLPTVLRHEAPRGRPATPRSVPGADPSSLRSSG